MKKKKSLLSLGILALVLVLGVGYAVVSAVDLTFGGTATVADAVIKVDIENAVAVPSGKATTTHTWTEGSHATSDTFTITGMALNETVTITYTLKNHETDVAANIAEKGALTNSNSEYFEVTKTIDDPTIAANGTGTVTVKVKLKKTPVDEDYDSTTVNFSVEATAADNHVAG